ncbi:MAG: hypothetical protein CMH83_10290 [Nocardioides sp.]|nr:hypothetical protein [Nocardioides sp.]
MTARPVRGKVRWEALDPFELPETLGTEEVVWEAVDAIASGPVVRGLLEAGADTTLACDLLAVDEAYPVAVADSGLRVAAHQAWHHGQVQIVAVEDRVTLAVPGTRFAADDVLEVVARLARAVGATPTSYAVRLRVGG